jgi:urease accessory protein
MTRLYAPEVINKNDAAGWLARLELDFAKRGSRTVITRQKHLGPLVVQRPFYPEGDTCHVYLLHPPGGVVPGDQLHVQVCAESDAKVLLTTPAANKIYRSHGPRSIVEQHIRVGQGARVEWLPQGSIFFNGCSVSNTTSVEIEPGGQFAGWEIVILGRPAAGETFENGHCRQSFEIWTQDRPLMLDRADYEGGSPVLQARWGLAGYCVIGTFAVYPANRFALDAIRARVHADSGSWFSASLLDDLLICRYLGGSAESAQRYFTLAWEAFRPILFEPPACLPRIWRT